ncbi:MAG TPA: Na+/H+ antiporter [Marmoricola sp.]|nr:Na+/H+ antiporter [Marmoricola sp.]
MHLVLGLVCIAVTVVTVAGLCKRLGLPTPLVMIVVGMIGAYLPFIPEVHLNPAVVLLGILPPLLYDASLNTSLVDFNANRRTILLLSVGLVAATTGVVGVVVHAVIPSISWWAAFAIGAVVAPPDAVAASAIGRRIGLPRKLVTILEGESLLNDATALVALQTAIAATVSWQHLTVDFARASLGGVAVGLIAFGLVGFVRKKITDPVIDNTLSFVTPFAAYIAGEELKVSGVLAVVVAGLLLGHKAPILQTAQSRISERLTWHTVAFLLENAVFLLIGLQARSIVSAADHSHLAWVTIVAVCAATLATVIVVRIVWVFTVGYVLVKPPEGQRPSVVYPILLSWAGMRGVVTLAAAFVIPVNAPHRDVLLLIAFTTVAGTLFLQGLSLPGLARALKAPAPDPVSDALARANLLHQASQAGLACLDGFEDDPHGVAQVLRDRVERRDFAAWEQVNVTADRTPSEIYAARRRDMINAERARVLEIRSTGKVPHEVVSQVLAMLDVEESMLDYSDRDRDRVRAATLNQPTGGCEDLRVCWDPPMPKTAGQCDACVETGVAWVHLRMCLDCGNVACCDSSPLRHATAHFHQTGHPVMRSAEPDEEWRWCYVHELTG